MMKTTTQKLDKTSKSLSNHVHGGKYYRGMGNARTQDLVYLYEELMELALKEGVWNDWCDANALSRDHTAFDCLA